jgi:high-affinity Fe2+/Pb2+ permease
MIYRTRLFGATECFVLALISAGLFVHFSGASFDNVLAGIMAIVSAGFVYIGVSHYKDRNEDLKSEIRAEREYINLDETKRDIGERIAQIEREISRIHNSKN